MIDWVTVIEGVGILGGGAVTLIKVGRWQKSIEAEIEARTTRNGSRIDAHEHGCEEAWAEAKASFRELKSMLTEQNERTQEHREAVNGQLGTIRESVARLEENQRMRERLEDQR